jgi:D-lactate dehydrogenase
MSELDERACRIDEDSMIILPNAVNVKRRGVVGLVLDRELHARRWQVVAREEARRNAAGGDTVMAETRRKSKRWSDPRNPSRNVEPTAPVARPSKWSDLPSKRPVMVFCEVADWEEQWFRRAFPDYPLRFFKEPVDRVPAADLADANVLSVFIHSPVTAEILSRMPHLRMIATRSTGFDHIDLEACDARHIVVSNVPHYGENTVAEFTFALMLALARHLVDAVGRTRSGDFRLNGLQGIDLRGKTLGVIGAGHIGLHVIRIGRGFAMDVLAYDVRPQPLIAEVLGFTYVGLDELLARSDIVSLHVPGMPATYHLMNRERFAKMKRGAILINTARGTVVDSQALLWALTEGIVAAAGLDVIEGEELIKEEAALLSAPEAAEKMRLVLFQHALLRHPNVIITPHMAFDTREALERIVETTADNIRGYLSGCPTNVVNPAVLHMKPAA